MSKLFKYGSKTRPQLGRYMPTNIWYTQACINRIINEVSLYDVIKDLWMTPIPFKNKHRFYLSMSPFDWSHYSRRSRPFYFSTNRRRFKCFHSGNSGNVINFVQQFLKLTRREAITYLCIKYNVRTDIVVTHHILGNDDNLPF